MATKIHMEALSPTMEEGQVVSWSKQEGDAVQEGDILAEIETDKAVMELVARGSGVLRKQLLAEGGTAAVGALIGIIAAEDEDISELLQDAPSASEAEPQAEPKPQPAAAEPGVAEGEADRAEPEAAETDADRAEPEAADRRHRASPLARRLAAEAGLEVSGVEGTGPGGRVTKRDIEKAVAEPAPTSAPAGDLPAALAGRRVEELPVSQMRKTIARRLVTSIGPVPTFYLTVEVDAERLLEVRERINARLDADGERVSINDVLVKVVAEALRRHPEVNASWHGETVKHYGYVHVGLAVAVEDGLITPVIRDADLKTAVEIGRETRELAARAREKKLQPDEYTGATFTVSNLGMFGIEEFTAIINPPEAGILAVGQVMAKPVVEEGQLVVRQRMRITMSCDHRVVDGATGARFLKTLKLFLEEPGLTLG